MYQLDEFNPISDNFQYDGISLPTPNKYWETYTEVNRDMERLIDSGEMIGEKIGDAVSIHWKYRKISAYLYNLLVNTCVKNGGDSPFHTLKTLNNEDKPYTLVVYRASEFNQEPDDEDAVEFKDETLEDLYSEGNVIRYRTYSDVVLEFICKKVRE